MALETLKGIKEIGGFPIGEEGTPVLLDFEDNLLAIQFQNGPIKEVGVNGVQIETLVHIYSRIVEEFNKKFPHPENDVILKHAKGIIEATKRRKKERESRGVEGQSKL